MPLTPIIETHAHLDSLKSAPIAEIIESAQASNVTTIITVATELTNFSTMLDLAQKYPFVFATLGVHPHSANSWNEEVAEEIKKQVQNKEQSKIVAIGEIGLDYHYNFSPREQQITAFEKQLELSMELNLPVVIHSREADQDMISIIKTQKARGVFHSYSSGEKLAETALDLGFYLGFNGMVTFKGAENVRAILINTALDRILLETDCPYLAPVPHRGKENQPAYLPLIAKKISEVKKVSMEELCQYAYQNSIRLFAIPTI